MRALTHSAHSKQLGALLITLLFVLSACGGGSGGSSSGATTATTGSSGPVAGAPAGGDPAAGDPVAGDPDPVFTPTPTPTGVMDPEAAFAQTVYPLTELYCVNCHAGAGPGFPHIAHPDVGTAYRAVVDNQKVNFATPDSSRLVERLVTDNHFCWSGDCAMDGAEMSAAIVEWGNLFGFTPVTGATGGGTGTGTAMPGGVLASFTNSFANATQVDVQRFDGNIIALWTFEEEQGDVTADLSGVQPAMDLTLTGTEWIPGGGINIVSGKATSNPTDSQKLFDMIASGNGSQAYSIEAWITPGNVTQEGPARIVTYSQGTSERNFTLGQALYNYNFRNRNMDPNIGINGTPALETADADEDLQATLQHVVSTYDQTSGRRIYVNGQFTDDVDEFAAEPLVNWDPTYTFVLGNETSDNRLWMGQMRHVAIYNVALTPTQIMQNYSAGALDRFTLRFGLDDYLDVGDYIEFEISEFDAYSYQFCFPTLTTANPNGFMVESIRIAVNGTPPVASQSFSQISTTVTQSPQVLSTLCSVVSKELGSNLDQFAVFFDLIAGNDVRVVAVVPTPTLDLSVTPPGPDVGIRDYDRINDTMSEITGVDPNTASVQAAFDDLRQQLPMDTDIRSFVSSHQVGIAKLALEYCNELVDSVALREAFFGMVFQFNQPVPPAFASQVERDIIINALVDQMVGTALATQPNFAEISPVLNMLFDDLTAGCTPATCDASRTQTVVKAACSSVLGSAAVTIH